MGAKSKVKRREKGEAPIQPPSSFEKEISDFLAWVQLEKGLAENTVSSYENDLIQCALISSEGCGYQGWKEVELIHLSGWLASLTKGSMRFQSFQKIICSSHVSQILNGRKC